MDVALLCSDPRRGERLAETLRAAGHTVVAPGPADTLVDASLLVLGSSDPDEIEAACDRVRRTDLCTYTFVLLVTDDPEVGRSAAGREGGPDDVRLEPVSAVELDTALRLGRRVSARENHVTDQRRELVDLTAQLFEQGRFDPLTGVGNRRAMDEHLASLWARAVRLGQPFCVALFDIDHFKTLNDSMGHDEGDRVLRRVAQALATGRPSDALHRYGGEEFLVTVPEDSVERALGAAERRRRAVEELAIANAAGDAGRVTVSGGVACFDRDRDESVEALVARADAALYRAKQAGRNRVLAG